MRISDWSSDVCSSDLLGERLQILFKQRGQLQQQIAALIAGQRTPRRTGRTRRLHGGVDILWRSQRDLAGDLRGRRIDMRSEEHTSELQSLMRISYAVFCLKKNN